MKQIVTNVKHTGSSTKAPSLFTHGENELSELDIETGEIGSNVKNMP
jgi:hypothetical protein